MDPMPNDGRLPLSDDMRTVEDYDVEIRCRKRECSEAEDYIATQSRRSPDNQPILRDITDSAF